MSVTVNGFSHLMQGVADGDQTAFSQLFHLYNQFVLAQLRSRLKRIRWLRSLLDAEDLCQEIWISLSTAPPDWRQFPTPGAFQGYLARMARNQILKAARHHLDVQKRDARRCQCLGEARTNAEASGVVDPFPSPARTVEVRDECESRLSSLTNEHQQLAHLIKEGYNHAEIAGKLGYSQRTIERKMGDIRQSFVD